MRIDYFTEHGASILAARIARYWRRRGKDTKVWIEPFHDTDPNRGEKLWAVRSDNVGAKKR